MPVGIIAWLLAIAWPLAKKILVSLGIGVVTYTGLTLIGNQISDSVISIWGQVPASLMQIGSLLGIPQAIGITLGAFSARLTYVAASKIARIAQ